ncbi:MAG: phosphate ABC transporter substrate-binding protein PstS [Thaumarchaeota archaeon]|nr:phosphate ABC transporter substrate-binding protein PstS [Nitrososphaerota archaeon]
MRLSKKTAVSSTVTAVVAVVVILVIVAGIYILKPFGGGGTVTTTVTTGTSGTTSTSPTTPLTLQAGGSSFVNPVMQVWVAGFSDYTNGAVKTNYQAIGSGAGITGILKGTFDFAGSDAPVASSVSGNYTAVKGPLLQIPETLGAVAIFYNIPGVKVNLNLTGPIIADIYLQKITLWNDPAIRALNPKVADLNATTNITIIPVHRSDGSGTTYALTNYFSKVSADWNASGKGFGTSINWPAAGELAGKGSAGVAAYVGQNPLAVGYADSYYAFSNKLLSAAVQNKAGNFLQPSLAGVTSAASDFSSQVQSNPTFSITNAPGAASYPISTYTYLLVWQNQGSQGKGNDVAQLFWWIVTHGQSLGPPLFYPSLPASVVTTDQSLIAKMNYNGTPFIQSG